MSAFHSFARWMRLGGFWAQRVHFYQDLAKAIEDAELLASFVDGELAIAQAPMTYDKAKIAGLRYMRNLIDAGYVAIDEVLILAMPAADAMGLRVVRDAQDKAAALRFLADNIVQQQAMSQVVRKALASPLLLVPIALVFAFVLSSFSIPIFEKAAPPEIWTGFAQWVRQAAHAVRYWGPWLLSGLALGLLWFVVWALPELTAPWRYRIERASSKQRKWLVLLGPLQPMLTIYRDVQCSRMLANLATLLQAGTGLHDALADLSVQASPWMRKHLQWVLEHLQMEPGDYVGAFSRGVLSTALLGRLSSKVRRDAGGEFSKVLIALGTTGQEQARQDVQKYAARANTALLGLSLSIVLFFYIGQLFIVFKVQEAHSPAHVMQRSMQQKAR